MIEIFLIIVVLAYLSVMAMLYYRQHHHLYNPSSTLTTTPLSINLEYESIHFTTEDNLNLHGWYIPHADCQNTLLFFHGNTGNISDCIRSISQLHKLGLSVFIFDYRGYGISEGTPSEKGTYKDAMAAWHYLTKTRAINPDNIIILGRSLGAAIASQLATKVSPQALILEATFTSLGDIAAQRYWFIPARKLIRYQYPVLENLRCVTAPVLLIHSDDDKTISITHGRTLYDAANEPKSFLKIMGSHHEGHLESGEYYLNGLKNFIALTKPNKKQ